MDNLHLLEEVSALKKLRKEYERQLGMFGIELNDLPDECMAKLTDCIELKIATKIHELDMNYLEEFYFTKKKEQIDHNLAVAKLQNEIRDLEEQIEAENLESNQLQKFTTSVSKCVMSEAEMENNKVAIEKKIDDLSQRQKSFTIPDDINIDGLIDKLELLEKQKENAKATRKTSEK